MTGAGDRMKARNPASEATRAGGGIVSVLRWGGLGVLEGLAIIGLLYLTIFPLAVALLGVVHGEGLKGSLPLLLLSSAVAIVAAIYLAPRAVRNLRASRDPYMQEELLGESRPRMREFRYSLHLMRRSTLTMVGLGIIVFYVFISIAGPYLAPVVYGISLNEKHVPPGQAAIATLSVKGANATSASWVNASLVLLNDGRYAQSEALGDTLIVSGYNMVSGPPFSPATVSGLEIGVKYYSPIGNVVSVAVSWDGGSSWSADQTPPVKAQDDGNLWYLSFSNAHAWDATRIANFGIQIRLAHVLGGAPTNGTVYVDDAEMRLTLLGSVHLLGTNELGEDIVSGLLIGTGVDMRIGILVVFGAVAIGVVLGVFSGYYGKGIDEVVMRITDMFLAVPGLILALAFAAILGRSLDNILIALMLVSWPGYTRLIRGQVLSAREVAYVEAARAVGSPTRRIVMRHILPNVIAPVIVAATLDLGTIVISTAALSFLGLGAAPYEAEWGIMISRGYTYMASGYWWEFVPPGIAILLFVLAFNLFGDGVRDILDPRLRR